MREIDSESTSKSYLGIPRSLLRGGFVLFSALAPVAALASMHRVDLGPLSPVGVTSGIGSILCRIADATFTIAIAAAVIAFLVAAYFYLTSGGSEQRVSRAKSALTYAVLGVAVAILAWGAWFIVAGLLKGIPSGPSVTPCS